MHSRLLQLSALLVYALLGVYIINHLSLRSDISFFLPDNNTSGSTLLQQQLQHSEASQFIFIALGQNTSGKHVPPVSRQQLAAINKQIAQQLRSSPAFTQVENGQFEDKVLFSEPFYAYRYLLYDKTEQLMREDHLKHQLQFLEKRLDALLSPLEWRLFAEDPAGVWLKWFKQWQRHSLIKVEGVWFSLEKDKTLLLVKTAANGFDLQQQAENIKQIQTAVQQAINAVLRPPAKSQDIRIILSGAPVFALSSKQSISEQIQTISVLASVLLFLFLYWCFRSIKILVLLALPLSFAVLCGLAAVLWFDGFIHGITLAFGITIIGVVVDYPVHLYTQGLFSSLCSGQVSIVQNSDTQDTGNQNIDTQVPPTKQLSSLYLSRKMRAIWPAIRLGLVTTVIGFSALMASDFSGLRQLGVFAVSGLMGAALCVRFWLPSFSVPVSGRQSACEWGHRLYQNPWRKQLSVVAVVLPVAALLYIYSSADHLWENDLAALSPVPQWQKQQDFELRKSMGSPELRFAFVLQADNADTLLKSSETLKPMLERLQAKKVISGYDMAARYLPSRSTQELRQQRLPDARQVEQELTELLQETNLSPEAFTPFIQAIKTTKTLPPLDIRMVQASADKPVISQKMAALIYPDKAYTQTDSQTENMSVNWTAIIPLQGVQVDKLQDNPLFHTILTQFANEQVTVQWLDLKARSEQMLMDYRNDALMWFMGGLVLILLILFVHYRELKTIMVLLWPVAGAIIMTIASILLSGESLSVFHLVTLLLVLGLGIDYSIFTYQRSETAWFSVIICLISTLIMFTGLSLSELPVLKAIGMTAALGAFYTWLLLYSLRKPEESL